MKATRGITAGSGTATMELMLLLLDCMHQLENTYGAVLVTKLYVDDLTLAARGHPSMVIEVLTSALNHVCHHFEQTLKMKVDRSSSPASRPSPSRLPRGSRRVPLS